MTRTQQCPICGAIEPLSEQTCRQCGARLTGEPLPPSSASMGSGLPRTAPPLALDPSRGDDDLYLSDLSKRMWRLLLVGLLAFVLLLVSGALILASRWPGSTGSAATSPTAPPTATPRALAPAVTATPTQNIMMSLPTVTPMPPTATPTPTVTPCYQTAGQGDTVLGMAYRCGHRDMAVVDLILEINNMKSPQELQLGQTLEIPWPTPTPVPGQETPAVEADAEIGEDVPDLTPTLRLNQFGTPDTLARYENIEPTLRPGHAWHIVTEGETILSIAYDYDTTIEVLSQINPEIPFLQCDYGDPTGGPNCVVLLSIGQRVRVPVPLPSPTPTFTPAGTLTPTPSATPTINAPYPLSPDDGARFAADQLVTLRWGSTGTLAKQERYIVHVRDLQTGQEYMAPVAELSYVLPGGWQPADGNRHAFEWWVAVGTLDAQGAVTAERYATTPRRFTWESR
ncbi:MAG: LysM peptidoglycan-binding domain-containing protein [Aggregatilineaceae bacterium]